MRAVFLITSTAVCDDMLQMGDAEVAWGEEPPSPCRFLVLLNTSAPGMSRVQDRLTAALAALAAGREGTHCFHHAENAAVSATDRVVLLPALAHRDFLSVIEQSSAVLDTWPLGAGVAAREALAFGTPVVTLPSPRCSGQITASIYEAMDEFAARASRMAAAVPGAASPQERVSLRAHLVASDPDNFARLAVVLGTNPAFLRQVRTAVLASKRAVFPVDDGLLEAVLWWQAALCHVARAAQEHSL